MNTSSWTSITSNGSHWAGEEPSAVEELFEVLAREPLDASFERFGNFIIRNPYEGVQTKAGEWSDGKPLFPGEDVTRFFGNFLCVSHVFNIDTTDPELAARLTAAIRANQRTAAYRQAKKKQP